MLVKRLFVLVVLIGLAVGPLAGSAQPSAPQRVALVVRFGDGSVFTKCIQFDEDQISGLDVLLRSGLRVVYEASSSMAAVCKIGNDGCDYPAEPCFCKCAGGSACVYWSYWHLKDGAWQYSQLGAASYFVRDGDVEGWSWGSGTPSDASPPPLLDFASICAPVPTATPAPTDTPLPAPTATPVPTDTPLPAPTATVAPTETPLPVPTATPAPTDTPLPAPTATPVPTETPLPTPTATSTPSDTPLPTSTPASSPTMILTATPMPSATVLAGAGAASATQPAQVGAGEYTPTPSPSPSEMPSATPAPPTPTEEHALAQITRARPSIGPTATSTWTPATRQPTIAPAAKTSSRPLRLIGLAAVGALLAVVVFMMCHKRRNATKRAR